MKLKRKKGFLAKISLKVVLKRREVLREIKDYNKGENRNYKMNLRNFSHGIVEHILKKRSTIQEMER